MPDIMDSKEKVFLISLGCAKNLVDSENILGLVREMGLEIVSDLEEATVAVVNTCGFVRPAVEESIETILDVCAGKGKGALERVYVVGCFVQRYGYKLRKEIPEVDGWLGTGQIHRIGEILAGQGKGSPRFQIGRPLFLADHTVARVQTTPFYTAYLKIAEGCSNRCSYCLIPNLTGPLRSRKLKSLVIEAEGMVARGVREINLIAQDTTMYGRDLQDGTCLEDLLERLLEIRGIGWIRVLYCHPHGISDRLLELLDGEEGLCPYLDIPLQHVNEGILRAMGRGIDRENPWQLIERIRSKTPHLSLRTTLMVGFPGEREEDFEELYEFVGQAAFDHLGTFVFSPEKGTPSARFKDVVPSNVAEDRRDALMRLQGEISKRKNEGMVNRIVPVLLEGVSPETDLLLKGRTSRMAPDVDGQVLINKGTGGLGEIVQVLITEAHPYDIVGEIL